MLIKSELHIMIRTKVYSAWLCNVSFFLALHNIPLIFLFGMHTELIFSEVCL